MLDWLKSVFNPKRWARIAIDSMDYLVPVLSNEIEKYKAEFNSLDSTQKAQWFVDQAQAWLKARLGL